jgi:predicted Zn-dependent protease with MMP-like domain
MRAQALGTQDAVGDRASIRGCPRGTKGRRRNNDPVIALSRERFEELVAAALDTIPSDLGKLMDNVAVLVEDESPSGQPTLLGLYEGVPLTERDRSYAGFLPDRITIFRRPIMRACTTEAEVVRQVRITVVHEVAHHFGIDDERLQELGYG